MISNETIDELKRRLPEYVNMITKPDRKAGRNMYACPLCQSGAHGGRDSDGAFSVTEDGQSWHCFACDQGGDIFELIGKVEGIERFPDRAKRLGDILGVDVKDDAVDSTQSHENDERGKSYHKTEKALKTQNTASERGYSISAYISECKKHIDDPEAVAYLDKRNISKGTALRYSLGYDPNKKFLIIPCSNDYYVARSTRPDPDRRYNNLKDVQVDLFNKADLYNDDGRPVFLTEGSIDALAVIEAGGLAVALNSTSNYRKFLEIVQKDRPTATLIICLDNDEAGKKARDELTAKLQELNIRYVVENIAGDYKDPDEALISDPEAFIESVTAAERDTVKPDNVKDYILKTMPADIEKLQADAERKTGFSNLDAELHSLYSGLYVIGGISSVGKTTFISQLGDQLAAAGSHVLYFSMEQSRLEMISKSISRQTAILDSDKAVNSLQIRLGAKGMLIDQATEKYIDAVGDRLNIIEGNYDCTVPYIEEYARSYARQNGATPVIIVDYLQTLSASVDPDTGRKLTDPKQVVDANIIALKRLSRSLETPVIVVSSVNRTNYLTPIDFESFKESGGIEFTSDCLLGLQLSKIHDPLFEKESDTVKKRNMIAAAKEEIPRQVELVCLKNRFGKSRFTCTYTYYPQFDYFKVDGADGFHTLPEGQRSLFDD